MMFFRPANNLSVDFGPSAIFAWPDQTAFFGVP
jgi:hypothetical protein